MYPYVRKLSWTSEKNQCIWISFNLIRIFHPVERARFNIESAYIHTDPSTVIEFHRRYCHLYCCHFIYGVHNFAFNCSKLFCWPNFRKKNWPLKKRLRDKSSEAVMISIRQMAMTHCWHDLGCRPRFSIPTASYWWYTMRTLSVLSVQWNSYQIRKITGCACAGNDRNVFPATLG